MQHTRWLLPGVVRHGCLSFQNFQVIRIKCKYQSYFQDVFYIYDIMKQMDSEGSGIRKQRVQATFSFIFN